jgi:DNA-binding NarL/FixJ family response regulator
MTFNESKIRVLIYSRYALFREGLKALLLQAYPIEVVGEAATPRQAVRLAETLHPDVLLLELAAGLDAVKVTIRIRALDPPVRVLVLLSQENEHLLSECLTAGVSGCIHKNAQPEQLKGAIYTACRGASYAA